jgi:3-deoxy-D-manno-octulosonic acid kinase
MQIDAGSFIATAISQRRSLDSGHRTAHNRAVMERIVRFGPVRILFAPDLDRPPRPQWFDPQWWRHQDAVEAEFGGRGQAVAVDSPAGPAVLRRYLRGGLVRHVNRDRYLYGGADTTRPFAEWRVTQRLHRHGLAVPRPLAAMYQRSGAFYRAALLTERIPGARPLPEVANEMDAEDWRSVGCLLALFATAGLRHPDINAANVVRDHDGRFWLLDFDRARLVDGSFDVGPMLGRLQRSLAKLGVAHDADALRSVQSQ